MNGFGEHRIEGIGDKHIPWVHNCRNTDAITAIDDDDTMRILRLFNEKDGHQFLTSIGVSESTIANLNLLGISSIYNLLAAIKTAKYFELNRHDIIFTVFTDSVELYNSRLLELNNDFGEYSELQAARDYAGVLEKQGIDYFKELNYYDRKQIHNLKYYTWVEQQGKTLQEIQEQWQPEYWEDIFENEVEYFDKLIEEFNRGV